MVATGKKNDIYSLSDLDNRIIKLNVTYCLSSYYAESSF